MPDTMITIKDKLGYAFGDLGLSLTFSLVGPFLTMFYTDVVGLPLGQITVMMLITRLWGSFADPLTGAFIDRCKPGRTGRFRRWLIILAVPQAVFGALLFVRPGFSTASLVWVYAVNLVYVTLFSGANIPYGSLASVISPLESDRSQLSLFRSLGAGIGSAPVAILLPMLVYSVNAAGVQSLDAAKLLRSVAALAVISLGFLAGGFAMTKERVAPSESKPKMGKTVTALLKNRPFLVLCLASMLNIGVVIYGQTLNSYLFKDYFLQPDLYSYYAIFTYAPMVILMFVMTPLVRRFGKKEVCAAGLVLSVAAYAAAFLLQLRNPWIYLALCFVNGLGLTCFTLQVWALVTDVLDYQAMLSGQRDEGTAYGFYFFSRKMGHTAAGFGGAFALKLLGYVEASDGVMAAQSSQVAEGMYRAATLVPAGALLIIFLLLAFAYPLGKEKLREMREAKMA